MFKGIIYLFGLSTTDRSFISKMNNWEIHNTPDFDVERFIVHRNDSKIVIVISNNDEEEKIIDMVKYITDLNHNYYMITQNIEWKSEGLPPPSGKISSDSKDIDVFLREITNRCPTKTSAEIALAKYMSIFMIIFFICYTFIAISYGTVN